MDRNRPPSSMDRAWSRIVNMATGHDGGAQMQDYIQRSAQREANGEVATLPTVEGLQQMIADLSDGDDNVVRSYIRDSLRSFEQLRRIEQLRAMEEKTRLRLRPSEEEESMPSAEAGEIIASDGGDLDLDQLSYSEEEVEEEEEEEEDSGIRFSPSQVDEILRTLGHRVEISRLETDELECSICKSAYGQQRGNISTEPVAVDEEFPTSGQAPEYPMKLSCGHIFGEWCIKRWLLERQPVSCPTCRFRFTLG